jgi:hypothetical protein
MARVGALLLLHADADIYRPLGASVEAVNRAVQSVLADGAPQAWDTLLRAMSQRRAFQREPSLAAEQLGVFGGSQIVHGHTTVAVLSGRSPTEVRAPLVYAGGLCIAVDGGLGQGGSGFVARLPPS